MKSKNKENNLKSKQSEAVAKWKEAKALSANMDDLTTEELQKVRSVIPEMSATSFLFCQKQMKALGLQGLP